MKIVRIAVVHNEADIIRRNLEWYIAEGFETIVLDDASTDGTFEICQEYVGRGVTVLERRARVEFDRRDTLIHLWRLTVAVNPDVVVLADADEFFESPDAQPLREAIETELSGDANVINLHNMEFWMTPRDDPHEMDPLKRIRYYSWFSSHLYRIFSFYSDLDIWSTLGHAPVFPARVRPRVSRRSFISRHYKFRNLEQAFRKIGVIVPPRGRPDEMFHYLKFSKDARCFIVSPERLTCYAEDKRWCLERLFDGNRMTLEETRAYLGLASVHDVQRLFASRTLRLADGE